MLLRLVRARLGIAATDEVGHWELARSGWGDVLANASCFHWRTWAGPPAVRRAWYREIRLHALQGGSLRELLEYVFTPVMWNNRLSVWHYPRRGRGGRGLIRRLDNGWWVVG